MPRGIPNLGRISPARVLARPAAWCAWCIELAVFPLLVLTAQAQMSPALDPDLAISQYVHDVWTVKDGLPQNSIFALQQSPDGYLWIGTQDGLVRFDGVRFTIFDKSDGLGNDEVRALLLDSSGALWIGTNGGGVSRYRDGTFISYTSEDGLSSDYVRSLFQDKRGNIWIGTIDGGLAKYDGSSFSHFTSEDGLAGDVVLAIAEEPDGALLIGTEGGLSRFENGIFSNLTALDGLPGDLVWAIRHGDSGEIWIGTSGGLARYFEGSLSVVELDGLCAENVDALHLDDAGALWIGSFGSGVCRLYEGRVERFSSHDGLSNDRVRSLFEDREGGLWIGTESGGLNRLRQGKFVHFTTSEGLSNGVVFSVLEDRDGTVWIGTEGGGLNRLHGDQISVLTSTTGLPGNDVYALAEGNEGELYIGFYDAGLCRLKNEKLTCFSTEDGLNSDNIYAVHEDDRGTVWIGTEAGLNLLRDGIISAFTGDRQLATAPITTIFEDKAGYVWVGSYGGGLRRVGGENIVQLTSANGFVDGNVLVLHEDGEGGLWAGTQGDGLCLVTVDETTCLSSEHGLPGDNVLQILEDDEGYLWLGLMQKIVRISRKEAVSVLSGRQKTITFKQFDTADGLKSHELNGGTQPVAWKSRDGLLRFATNDGIATIDPRHIRTNHVPPPVVIEGIFIENEPVPPGEKIELPPGSRDVTFRYTGLSFTAPEKVRFKYMLEGYDEHWIDAETRREAFYTNLGPGAYRFLVRAANEDGIWNEAGASVSFTLAPFFYQTAWFKLLVTLMGLLGAAAAYRLRIRQLKARERELERVVDERTRDLRLEKERTEEAKRVIEGQAEKLRELDRFKTRFFANVSHEFRTPLTMIIGPLENMLSSARDHLTEGGKTQLQMMLRNALRLMRLINQLLDLSKLEDGKMQLRARPRNVVLFLDGIVSSCSVLAEGKQLSLTFDSDAEEILLCFEPDKLEKVFYNLLSNAAKFTPAGGSISVSIAQKPAIESMPEGVVQLTFSDTGKGISAEHLSSIFDRFHQVDGSNTREHEGTGIGLALARELVLLHHGTIEVQSEVGSGTTFIVCLPMGQAHLQPDQFGSENTEVEFGREHSAITGLASAAFEYAEECDSPEIAGTKVNDDAPLILVVDDNKDVREYVAGILSDTYRIVTAQNGEEGLDTAMEVVPHLILSDVMMPKMDGNELCRRVKTTPELNHIPVVLLTARATHQLKLEGLEMGADDYVPKPFNAHELQVRIKNLLHLRHQEKELKELNDNLEGKVRQQFDQLVEQRRHYEEELIDSKERAEASDRLKSTILNNLSHEFRTPLTAILGFLQIIESEAPEELQEFTDEIERGSMRLLRTLDSLLQLSRIEADAVGSRRELVELTEMIGRIVEAFAPSAEGKGLELDFTSDYHGSLDVDIDRSAVEEVVSNIVDNAIKFTSAGRVAVRLDRTDDDVFISVTDSGIGMTPEFLPRMFDAFVQESEGLTRSYEGCGLGLTIAGRLVELMDGKIVVESKKGRGSTLTVSVPSRRATAA